MEILISLLAMYGLYFLLTQSDGPWGLMNKIRNMLINNKYIGVFFYKLFSCPFCSGCHTGWIVYILTNWQKGLHVNLLISYALTGGAVCLIIDTLLDWLHKPAI